MSAEVTFDRTDAGWTVISSHLHVTGLVPGIDQARFRELADQAKAGCPISRAISGNVEVRLDAVLDVATTMDMATTGRP